MSQIQRAVERVRRRVALAAWAGAALRQGAVLLALLGVLVVGLRLTGHWGPWARLVFTVLAVLPATAWWVSKGHIPSEQDAATWLDKASGGEGRLVTGQELGLDPAVATVLPETRLKRPARWAAAGVIFVGLTLLLPLRPVLAGIEISDPPAVQELSDQAAVLEEVLALDPEDQEALEEALEELREPKARANPEAALEAMDALESRMEELAAQAEQAARAAEEAMKEAMEAAQGAEQAAGENQDAAAQQAAQQAKKEALAQAAQAMAEMGTKMPQDSLKAMELAGLPKELLAQLGGEKMSAGQLQQAMSQLSAAQLAAAQQRMSQGLAEQLAKLAKAGLGERQGEGPGGGEGQGEGQGEGEGEGQGTCPVGQTCPGKGGGISSGAGASSITYGKERPDQSERFTPTLLSPGELDLASSALLGESFTDAQVHVVRGADGVTQTVLSTGENTNRRRLAPSHQQAVSTWFAVDEE
jgi:hypothetical protein